jgi:hypothetical protein
MKCLVCGAEYINVGVHAKRKHGLTADEYRLEFELLLTQPLIDEELSAHLRKAALRRLDDPEYKDVVSARMAAIATASKGTNKSTVVTKARTEAHAARNTRQNTEYLKSRAAEVQAVIDQGNTILDVRRQLGMGADAVKRMMSLGLVTYSYEEGAKIAAARRVAARQNNKSKR